MRTYSLRNLTSWLNSLNRSTAENISLQSSNCNILGLAATVGFFANEARFYSDLGVLPGMLSPKWCRWPPIIFTFLTSLTDHLSMVKFAEKNQCQKIFARKSLTWLSYRKVSKRSPCRLEREFESNSCNLQEHFLFSHFLSVLLWKLFRGNTYNSYIGHGITSENCVWSLQ